MSEVESSDIISGRMKRILGEKEVDEFFRPQYYKMLKECLDILDISYYPTAVGVLGKALENEIKEFLKNSIKSKKMLSVNSGDYSKARIIKAFDSESHDKRVKFLNGELVKIDNKEYKLKRKLLKLEDYNELLAIKNVRNDVFHGCSDERYIEIEAKSYSYLERGIIILTMLEKLNREYEDL